MGDKKREAMEIFVRIKMARGEYSIRALIDYTLKADRMQLDQLYRFIRSKGYRWSIKYQRWIQ